MNSKSILRSLLQTALALCLIIQTATAATSGKFTYTYNGVSITITGYPTSEFGALVIPTSIAGKPVTSIGDWAFADCIDLTSVTIPNSVTSIGAEAFVGCYGLSRITIGTSVTSIGDFAFNGCYGLTSVTIPNSVTSIGADAFDSCDGLTRVTIGTSVTSIGDDAFIGCSGLTIITIPNSVTAIGEQAFDSCTGLTSITIPGSVTSIGIVAFQNCTKLTKAVFLGNAPAMGWGVFDYCASDFTVNYLTGKTNFTSPTWNGYPAVAISPEIDVQQPLGSRLVDGTARKNFGTVKIGMTGSKYFTIKNTGTANLTGLAITSNGVNALDFTVTGPAKTWLTPGTSTTFKVTFKPTAAGNRYAAIHIKSNDLNEKPFDIHLGGLGVAP